MKRDMDLVRRILINLEESEEVCNFREIRIEGYNTNQISHHMKLLQQAGLIEAEEINSKIYYTWVAKTLTYQGHDFLEAVRDENIWSKIKSNVKSKGLEVSQLSFEALKDFAKLEVKRLLGV